MTYIYLFIFLLLVAVVYFRIADWFNIIDKPNERSSHTVVTIRGGGVVFYIAMLAYVIWSGFQFPYFFLGLSLMATISFLDDVFTLSNKLRILAHLLAVSCMLYQLNLFHYPWYSIVTAIFVVIGIVNAYNFMDGINGITTAYSFVVLLLLWMTNQHHHFIDPNYFYFIGIGNLIFFLFNFRNKAKCFAGDVGSVSISFILLFALFLLLQQTQNLIYLLFLAVYGIDVVITIAIRLIKGENIFQAHRSHLYQYLANEVGVNRLLIATLYALLQLGIGYAVIQIASSSRQIQWGFALVVLLLLSGFYTLLRRYVLRRYVHQQKNAKF